MAAAIKGLGKTKRKLDEGESIQESAPSLKKAQKSSSNIAKSETTTSISPLQAPHEKIISALSSKHNILASSVISSTKIQKRVTATTTHLLPLPGQTQENLPKVALLFARTREVHKLITVVEHVTRVLSEENKAWFQYNQLFESQEKKRSVEETSVDVGSDQEGNEEKEDDDDDDDDEAFEPMRTRFEKAVMPPAPSKMVMSLRVFISTTRITELDGMKGVTLQTSEDNLV